MNRPLREYMREATGRPFFDKEIKQIYFVRHPYYPEVWYWNKISIFQRIKEIYRR